MKHDTADGSEIGAYYLDTTELTTTDYQQLDRLDEQQIVAELQGALLDQYVYSFQSGGRNVIGLSWAGVKGAAPDVPAANKEDAIMKENCWSCAYKRSIPGNAHIRCAFAWHKSEFMMPTGQPHGVKNGWFHFPFNYDPRWMASQCKAWSEDRDEDLVFGDDDPLVGMLSLLYRNCRHKRKSY